MELASKHHEKALQVNILIIYFKRNFIYLYHLLKIIVYNFYKTIEHMIFTYNSLAKKLLHILKRHGH